MNVLASPLTRRIAHGVNWLAHAQEPDGEFPSVVATRADMRGTRAPDTNFFTTSQVLWSLSFVRASGVARLRRKAAAFIASGNEAGCWRFFSPKVRRRIDPDVDATACAAAALRAFNPHFDRSLTRAALLRARDREGRFLTWIRSGEHNDVDAVANANVLWALGNDPSTEGAASWLVTLVRERREEGSFPYYETPLALYHAMSRALWCGATMLEPARDALRAAVLAHQRADGGFGNALSSAFALCTLHNLGDHGSVAMARGLVRLRAQQRRDGAWPDCAAWNGPELPAPRTLWWGGHAWTTALALEALTRSERRPTTGSAP